MADNNLSLTLVTDGSGNASGSFQSHGAHLMRVALKPTTGTNPTVAVTTRVNGPIVTSPSGYSTTVQADGTPDNVDGAWMPEGTGVVNLSSGEIDHEYTVALWQTNSGSTHRHAADFTAAGDGTGSVSVPVGKGGWLMMFVLLDPLSADGDGNAVVDNAPVITLSNVPHPRPFQTAPVTIITESNVGSNVCSANVWDMVLPGTMECSFSGLTAGREYTIVFEVWRG